MMEVDDKDNSLIHTLTSDCRKLLTTDVRPLGQRRETDLSPQFKFKRSNTPFSISIYHSNSANSIVYKG